jgi:ubiquinone/menaquinone biosynthesis C-methylase UbiE
VGKRSEETRSVTSRRRRFSANALDYKRVIWEGHHYRFGLAGEGQADTIQGLLEPHPGEVLNIGCGPWGHKLKALATYCRSLTAVDREIEAIRRARAEAVSTSVHLLVGNVDDLPFPAETFDHVLALGLFAHIADPEPAFRELHRVCQPGAHLFITNAVRHARALYENAAAQTGFEGVHAEEGYCPEASGDVKRRYLLVFRRGDPNRSGKSKFLLE